MILIKWADGSQPLPNVNPIECNSVNWLIHDDENIKMVAPNMGDMESEDNILGVGILRIPTGSVKRIVKLEERI